MDEYDALDLTVLMRDIALEFGDEWREEGEDSDSEQALDQLQLGETDEDENELDVGDGELYASGGTHRIRRSASPRHGVYMSTHNGPATECSCSLTTSCLGTGK